MVIHSCISSLFVLNAGFYFTNMAIYHCDEVHLYGFWPFPHMIDKSLRNLSYHYFDEMKFDFEIKDRDVHVMDMEFSVLVQLHLLGVIKLHIGNCAKGYETKPAYYGMDKVSQTKF